jgi:hypothetical protein
MGEGRGQGVGVKVGVMFIALGVCICTVRLQGTCALTMSQMYLSPPHPHLARKTMAYSTKMHTLSTQDVLSHFQVEQSAGLKVKV